MLPFGASLNLGMALKQGRGMSFGWVLHSIFLPKISLWAETSDLTLVWSLGGWGGQCGRVGRPT